VREAPAREAAVVSIVDGAEGARRILVAGHLTLGRGDDAGLVIDDPEMSRTHAVIGQTPDGLEVRDLSSLNGTWVNGERIGGPTALVPGDIVKIGKTRIEVLAVGGPGLAPGARSSPTPVEAEDEVRPVSVLFADVVGSTPLAERLEPGDYAALMGGCVDRMCRAVEQFGGVIDAYMGDGIAAFFGFPAATEDDADRAASAALSVVEALEAYAEGLAQVFERAVLRGRLRGHRSELRGAVDWMNARLSRLSEAPAAAANGDAGGMPAMPVEVAELDELLTPRELEVLRLMARGNTNLAIAKALVVAEGTVKYHVKNVLRKLRAANRADAVARYERMTAGLPE